MNNKFITLVIALVIVLSGLYWVFGLPMVGNPEIPTSAEAIARGEYLYNAGGCDACHNHGGEFEGPIGGYVIEVENPFPNTFYTPNITPDEETGIGGWSGRDFILAMKHGRSPSGGFYWPAFPYRTYKNMTDEDVLDMAAYIMSQPAIHAEQPEHVLPAWQFDWLMSGWNILADFMEGEAPAVADTPEAQRGAYLARALGHCGECHTPRNQLGMMIMSDEFGGSEVVSTPINPEGLSSWTRFDFVGLLELGMTASFDFVGGEMADVVEHTSQLSPEDREAYAAFFIPNEDDSGDDFGFD